MDDPELQALRAQRMSEMQSQQPPGVGGGPNPMGGGPGGPGGDPKQKAANQKAENAAREEEMRNSILCQVLDQNARARISNIAVAKPEKAKQLEQMIVNMARFGQISGKLTDSQLKNLLDQVSERMPQKTTTVKFDRRRAALDSDDDDY